MNFLKKFSKKLVILFVCLGIILQGLVVAGGFEKPQKGDVIIVLGSTVKDSKPKPMLEYRLLKSIELYKNGYANKIIVTGGQGKNENLPEGTVMKNYLIEKGISSDDIFIEDKATSTYENFKFSKQIIDNNDYKKIIVVTSNFHILRSLWIAKVFGLDASGAPSGIDASDLMQYVREDAALIKYIIYYFL